MAAKEGHKRSAVRIGGLPYRSTKESLYPGRQPFCLDAGWDEELLKLEIESLQGADFDGAATGFDQTEIDKLFDVGQDVKTMTLMLKRN